MSTKKILSNIKTINFNGVDRKLKMDFNSLAYLEDELGISALDGSIFTQENLSKARVLRAVLYACMRSAGEDISLEEVGASLSIQNIGETMKSVAELLAGDATAEDGEKGKS